jgi:hypothetical protein
LGLLALVGVDRSGCFKQFIERKNPHINGWKDTILAIGGNETLLKAMAQAIRVYAMLVFQTPKKICKRMAYVISQFWFGIMKTSTRYRGWLCEKYATQKMWETWDLEIFTLLTFQCLQNKCRDFSPIAILVVRPFFVLSTILRVIY